MTQPRILVVGAGMAGMTAAHYLAEWSAQVYLVDSAPHIGGAFLLLDHTFTTDSCGLCLALPRQPSYCPTLSSDFHPHITLLPRTRLVALEGEPGSFIATLYHEPRYVDPDRCDNCGACAAVCPATQKSIHPAYPCSEQKAIYPPPPRAIPFAYALAPEACLHFSPSIGGTGGACAACAAVCPHGAIDLEAAPGEERIEVGVVLLAPGFVPFDAARAVEYGWGRCLNVVTNLQFERMLNRSGPTRGRLLRPSDGRTPRRVAFIHCVGSRNAALGRPYCSTSCCMITAKQACLARKAAPEAEVTVFTMDVRTAGKGYEQYFQRVAALPGVTYRRGRPAAVQELPGSRNLRLLTPDGEEEFDLVVLAVGLGPADGVRELAARTGIALDEYGFILPGDDGPGTTSRRGIFAAGAGLAPADVPEAVTQAAAAAALAAGVLINKSTNQQTSKSASQQTNQLTDQPSNIGLFLCTCHGTLEETLDFPALVAAGEHLRGVAHVERLEAACEEPGLEAIERAVAEHALNRIVVAGCSPHLYADRFEALMARLGLPTRLLARANVREGAAWAHGRGHAAATAVARGEVEMSVAGLRETPYHPFHPRPQETVARRVLVLGGGLAGMTAALTLAGLGVECDLVEREAQLGGNLRERFRTLEGLDAQALLAETAERVRQAERVRVWTEAELAGWSGVQGDFAAEIRTNGETRLEHYGALIVATGAEPATTTEYLYGQHPRVLTQRELELQIANSRLQSAICNLQSIVMIQCVESRDEAHPYCSRVCCAHAVKNALALKSLDPAVEVSILFRDIRMPGMQELYYQQARRLGVRFLRYEPPERPLVEVDGDRLRVTVRDTLYDETVTLEADLLALSTGIVPRDNRALADVLGVGLDEDGFFAEAHPKLRPTDLARPGIFLCGLAYGPRFITETIAQARAAALRAALVVARPAEPRHDIATVEADLCSFCGLCVTACPYGARVLDEEERVARVLDHLCQGCGACVAVCPNGASRQPALEPTQALALVDAALNK